MSQQRCQLGGYTYPYNPPGTNSNPLVRAVSVTEALSGRYFTDWGTSASRQEINQSWPTMESAFFEALQTKAAAGGTQSYIHEDGVTYTVIVMPPTYQKTVPGGDAYLDVALRLMVVSSP